MSKLTDEACRLIEQASEEERKIILAYLRARVPLHTLETEWNTTAEAILTAIARSSDLTLRGVRGILAEAIFEKRLLPELARNGRDAVKIIGDQSYDFLMERGQTQVRIQVKLQRKERGEPKEYAARSRASLKCPPGTMYVVEVQRTRSGEKDEEKTRPYRFGDFDILAVNLHPGTGDWERFAFTVGNWLLRRAKEPHLIEIFQPVPITPDDYWTMILAVASNGFWLERPNGSIRRRLRLWLTYVSACSTWRSLLVMEQKERRTACSVCNIYRIRHARL